MFRRTGGDSQTEREFYDDHSWITLIVILSNGITGFVISNLESHDLAYRSGVFEYNYIEDSRQGGHPVSALVRPPLKPLDLARLKAIMVQGFKDSEVPEYYRGYILKHLDEYEA